MPSLVQISTYEGQAEILASKNATITTYTVDSRYVTESTGADGQLRKILWEGQVMAVIPGTSLAVPNFASYGGTAIGVARQRVDVTNGNDAFPMVYEGVVRESRIIDDGVYGTALAATKSALSSRIQFVADRI